MFTTMHSSVCLILSREFKTLNIFYCNNYYYHVYSFQISCMALFVYTIGSDCQATVSNTQDDQQQANYPPTCSIYTTEW